MAKFTLNMNDVDVVAFRRSRGIGGQHNNKTATAVRMLHRPSGIRVEACKERSLSANKEAARVALESRIIELIDTHVLKKQREAYESKPQVAFASQDRTYRLAGHRSVTDHRTGYSTSNVGAVLDGRIDEFLRHGLLASR